MFHNATTLHERNIQKRSDSPSLDKLFAKTDRGINHGAQHYKDTKLGSKLDNKLPFATSDASKHSDPDSNKTILYIHSLLFCSNSGYFQKLLMSSSREKNVRIYLRHGETAYFVKLIRLFYDDSEISTMPLIDTVHVLKIAKRYTCLNLTSKLLDHISNCNISYVRTLNQSIEIYYDLLNYDSDDMDDLIVRIKRSCLKYLKLLFCPIEKVFGPLLSDFLNLTYDAVYFFLDNVDVGMAVTEDNIVGLIMHWIVRNELYSREKRSDFAVKLLDRCRVEHTSRTFILDVLSRPHAVIASCPDFPDFYLRWTEHHLTPDPAVYFPDTFRRNKRTRNFAYDHEVMLYFAPQGGSADSMLTALETEEPNVVFVRGYELTLSSGVFQMNKEKELRVQFTVLNVDRVPHSCLYFSMLYAVNSPSVSEHFSPWNHCTVAIDATQTRNWVMVSLIAEHSLITETGFYLKFYIE